MKSLLLTPVLLSLATAALVPRQANYDGYQVVRLQVGNNLTEVQNTIKTLSLSTWNGGPKPNSEVDIVVPPNVAEQFEADTAGLSSSVMHANLGESIAQETDYPSYRSMPTVQLLSRWFHADTLVLIKPAALTLAGSTHIIYMRIMSNF